MSKKEKKQFTIVIFLRESFENLTKHYYLSINLFHEFIVSEIPGYFDLWLLIARWFYNADISTTYVRIIFIFSIVPRIILAFSFCISICYYHNLILFYKMLPILLVPLILKTFLGILRRFYLLNKDIIPSYIRAVKLSFEERLKLNVPDGSNIYEFVSEEYPLGEERDIIWFIENVYIIVVCLEDRLNLFVTLQEKYILYSTVYLKYVWLLPISYIITGLVYIFFG